MKIGTAILTMGLMLAFVAIGYGIGRYGTSAAEQEQLCRYHASRVQALLDIATKAPNEFRSLLQPNVEEAKLAAIQDGCEVREVMAPSAVKRKAK